MQRFLHTVLGTSKASLIGRFVHDDAHIETLSQLAAAALAANNLHLSWLLADRRCRMQQPLPDTLHYVFRSEVLSRLGDRKAALDDIHKALEIEPESRLALHRMVAWGDGPARLSAARRLVLLDDDRAALPAALRLLAANGNTAAGAARIVDGEIHGWAAWRGTAQCTITLAAATGTETFTIAPAADHPLSQIFGAAAQFVRNTTVDFGQWSGLATDDGTSIVLEKRFSGFAASAKQHNRARSQAASTLVEPKPKITVIVPVYLDLNATRNCLESLMASLGNSSHTIQILVVNDASPDPEIGAYLMTLAQRSSVDIVTNERNLGFVGTVNKALALVPDGDVVLLNADTILPPNAISRLADAADADRTIGTVTPLSNNGELMSMPIPHAANPLPRQGELLRIDAIAQVVNKAVIVDVPSGIGFCLYVTRACLDAVGGLSERYERGYGEDEHLCLSARAAGFRNVCAASIYVGHVGSLSFGAEKRALVLRNSRRIDALFPSHQAELKAFVLADPLRPFRHAISRSLLAGRGGQLLAAGPASKSQATLYLQHLAAAGSAGTLLCSSRSTTELSAINQHGTLYEFARFAHNDERLETELNTCLSALQVNRVSIFDPTVFDRLNLQTLDVPFDFHVADASMVLRRGTPVSVTAPDAISRYLDLLDHADTVTAWDDAACSLAVGLQPGIADRILPPPAAAPTVTTTSPFPSSPGAMPRLGILFVAETAACRSLTVALATALRRPTSALPCVIVLGASANELWLLRQGGVMITGALDQSELDAVVGRYGITHLFALSSSAIFGAPIVAAAGRCGRPLAQFDWRIGKLEPDGAMRRSDCLALDPASSDRDIVDRITQWMIGVTNTNDGNSGN